MTKPAEIHVERCMVPGCEGPMGVGDLVCGSHWKRTPSWMKRRLWQAQKERSAMTKRKDTIAVAGMIVEYLSQLKVVLA